MSKATISPERQGMYYCGMALSIIGFLTFVSAFFMVANDPFGSSAQPSVTYGASPGENPERYRNFFDQPNTTFSPSRNPHGPPPFFIRALTGMGLLIVGGILMGVGEKGVAGSGIVLDPEKARDDLKPWSHMAGGMLDDALSQSEHAKKLTGEKSAPVIKIRCTACRNLNDEDAKFCDECGAKM